MKPITTMMTALLLLAGSAWCAAAPAGYPEDGALAPLPGRFLVADRGLYGPYFGKAVVYLIQHNSEGSVGVVINHPLDKKLADTRPDLNAEDPASYPVYKGGPVSPHIVVMLFRGYYQTELAVHVSDDVYASSNMAMLMQLMQAHKPGSELRMYAGQADWGPGQLARELERGYWYVTEGDTDAIFSADADYLWSKLINRLDPLGIMAEND